MKKKTINSSRIPIYRDAGFELFNADKAALAFTDEAHNPKHDPDFYIYSRYRNPTVVAAEEEIMKLECCDWALLTQTGMAAIDVAVSIFQKGKDSEPWLFFSEIYGGTISFANSVLKARRGLDIQTFFPENERYDLDKFEDMVSSLRPAFIYFEAISNPMLIVPDAEQVINIAHKYGAATIVDNTFATPALWKPLDSAADIVIHSATKYLSGHGNLTAGVLCGNNENIMKSALEYRKFAGHMISPDDAYRLHTQMQSFSLRFRQQMENAHRLSGLLQKSPCISKIWYPGIASHPTHAEAVKLFRDKGFGAMITLDFEGETKEHKRIERDRFISSVSDRIKLIPSLGDSKSSLLPVESVWGAKYPEPGMIRFSAGIEDYSELEQVLRSALQ